MFNLSNIFSKNTKEAIMSKEELASFLKTTPEALRKFEESYQLNVMDDPKISDNLFQVNAKQAAILNPKFEQNEEEMVQKLIDRIVSQLTHD